LNLFNLPITFSFATRSEEIFRFSFFSSGVNGLFLQSLYAHLPTVCQSISITYPTHSAFFEELKSCFFSLLKAVQITFIDGKARIRQDDGKFKEIPVHEFIHVGDKFTKEMFKR
jgi:hypothetical protein